MTIKSCPPTVKSTKTSCKTLSAVDSSFPFRGFCFLWQNLCFACIGLGPMACLFPIRFFVDKAMYHIQICNWNKLRICYMVEVDSNWRLPNEIFNFRYFFCFKDFICFMWVFFSMNWILLVWTPPEVGGCGHLGGKLGWWLRWNWSNLWVVGILGLSS